MRLAGFALVMMEQPSCIVLIAGIPIKAVDGPSLTVSCWSVFLAVCRLLAGMMQPISCDATAAYHGRLQQRAMHGKFMEAR